MTRRSKKESAPEKCLEQSLVSVNEQPYPVPENWQWVRFDSLVNVLNGYAFKSERYVQEGIRIIRIANVQDGYVEDEKPVYYPYSSEEEISGFLLQENDLLMSLTGNVGRIAFLPAYLLPAALNQRVACLRIKKPTCLMDRFLYYYLLRREFQDNCTKNSKGSAQLNMSTEWLKKQPIPLPPYSEQQRIVSCIDKLFSQLDEAKEKAQFVVDGYEDRITALLHNAFSGNLTSTWRLKNKVSMESWQTVALSDVCKVNPPKANVKALPDELEVSFFPMPALSEVSGEITEPQTRKLREVRTGFTSFIEGDVVFAKITPCMENGKSAIIGKLVNDIGFGTTEFYVLRCSEKINNRFLWHTIRNRSFREKAKAVMTGAVGQQRVPKSFLEEYSIQLPLIDEQKEIVRLLDNTIKKEQAMTQKAGIVINQIDMMKKSILARVYRGEYDTNDPTDIAISLS